MKFKMIPEDTLTMTTHVGFATDGEGTKIEMLISHPACMPIVEFKGRRAMLDWQDMVPEARKLIEAELEKAEEEKNLTSMGDAVKKKGKDKTDASRKG